MREIKLRAWDIESNKYFKYNEYDEYKFEIFDITGAEELGYFGDLIAGKDKGYILEQYTGLPDCLRIDIYAGDVVYIAGYGNYVAEFPFQELYDAAMEKDIGAIQGNIHENPELS